MSIFSKNKQQCPSLSATTDVMTSAILSKAVSSWSPHPHHHPHPLQPQTLNPSLIMYRLGGSWGVGGGGEGGGSGGRRGGRGPECLA